RGEPGAAVADPGGGGRGHLQPAHPDPVRARARASARPARGGRPARRVGRRLRSPPRRAPAACRRRRPPGRALVLRVVRLLPDLHARQPVFGHPVGADRGRPARHRGPARPGRVRAAARLAADAYPPRGPHPRGRRPDQRRHRLAAPPRAVHALPVGQVRAALRRRGARVSTAGGVVELFCDLAAISSPSRDERAVADVVLERLRGMGLDPVEDDSGARTGSNIGNIHVALPATDGAGGTPIFLNAHLDTVPPDGAVEPEIRNGIVVNRRDTILGADNKAAVAVMLEAFARLASGTPHAGVELVLTPMEEVGLQGAKAFDTSRLTAPFGYCYDHAAPIGNVVLAAPTQKSLELRFLGRAAHSGIAPEEGRSAIAAAARAIAD